MMADLALRSGLSAAGGVFIAPRAAARLCFDDTGLDILPGFIDLHGDAFERALAPRPGVTLPVGIAIAEVEAQLLAAGVTTAYLAVTLSWEAGLRSAETYRLLRDALARRPPGQLPDLRLHVRFEAANLDALDMLLADIASGHVHMLSFNDHTPSIVKKLPNPVAVSKFAERSGQSYEAFCADARRAGEVPRARIEAAHLRLAGAAREAGIPMASHDDRTPRERAYFRALGAQISEFPTTVEVALAAMASGEPTVMGAPNVVRGGSHTGWHGAEALVRRRACSILCSDYHYPSLLQAVYRLARNASASFGEAVALVTGNAAAAANLSDRGSLEHGRRADFLLVESGDLPRIVATVAAGRIAYLAPGAAARLQTSA
ncbi:alpha-D-ribose 1-methylphosphonate 5-triphosphate diphosphatase [Acidocella sp.]|uniref:alpha-D-ribose 1-methylphosphonate 5-triphosphate diphosphatase n=1 Tax=Acidocella sp. TaxID=50710 RepID=UPI003CFE51C5